MLRLIRHVCMGKILTILAFLCFVHPAQAEKISWDQFKQLSYCDVSSPIFQQIADVLEDSWERILEEEKVYYYEPLDRRIRDIHYCIEECQCILTTYARDLDRNRSVSPYTISLFDVQAVRVTGSGVLPVEVTAENGIGVAHYQFHVALLLEHQHKECVVLVDPIDRVEPIYEPQGVGRPYTIIRCKCLVHVQPCAVK